MIPAGIIGAAIAAALRKRKAPPTAQNRSELDGVAAVKAAFYALAIMLGLAWTRPGFFLLEDSRGGFRVLTLGAFAGWCATIAPHWFAWRVCRPLGLRRVGDLALRLAAHAYPGQKQGRRRLFAVALGATPPRLKTPPGVDAWTACTAVLEAEKRGDAAAAALFADGLLAVAPERTLSRGVRRIGADLVARAAAARGDWPEAARRASLGRGRGARFLRLLARRHLRGDVPRALLWSAWLLAPERRANLRLLEAASPAAIEPRAPAGAPHRIHLELLRRAARGEEIRLRDVVALAAAWGDALAPTRAAAFRARALELGSRRSLETFEELRRSILADLVAVARRARGPWPASELAGLAPELRDALHDDAFETIVAIAGPRRGARSAVGADPLEEWRLWLVFRDANERLATRFGEEALRQAWYATAQLAAWNWPCRLLEVHGKTSAWACHVMFRWTTEMAERCGDEEAARVNAKNAEIARQRIRAA